MPTGVTSVVVTAAGASGADGVGTVQPGTNGGLGASVIGVLTVSPGETLYAEVGGPGGLGQRNAGGGATGGSGGFNGGATGADGDVSAGGSGGGGGGSSLGQAGAEISTDTTGVPLALFGFLFSGADPDDFVVGAGDCQRTLALGQSCQLIAPRRALTFGRYTLTLTSRGRGGGRITTRRPVTLT